MQLFDRCGWCCLVGTWGGREGGVVFDWGLLAPPALFLFVNTLAGNVVIIVAEASICSLGGGLPSFQIHFPQVLMGGRGGSGARGGGAQPRFIYPGLSARSEARLSPFVPANGSTPAGSDRRRPLE